MVPQVSELFITQLKHEVVGKPIRIALHRLVDFLGRNSVEFRQAGVENDPLPADRENRSINALLRNQELSRHGSLGDVPE